MPKGIVVSMVAIAIAIAIEESERTLGYRNDYTCSSIVVPGSAWQKQCNARFLNSFNRYDAANIFPMAGRV